MTNAELITALRNCSSPTVGSCMDCPYYKGVSCKWQMMEDAADALEAADKRIKELESQAAFFDAEKLNYQENIVYRDERIKELEAQMPKEGEWIELDDPICYSKQCSVCGAAVRVCIGEMCTTAETYAKYCPNCGARMETVTDCHTLGESERKE